MRPGRISRAADAPDVLYRVRMGQRNEQLRYSLRSLANVPHGAIHIVGYMPPWVRGVHHITGSRELHKWRIVLDHLAIATRELRGRSLLLVDDDFMVLSPVSHVPPMHAGPLLEHGWQKRGSYQRTLMATDGWLRARGVTRPLSYELHVPMPIDADAAADVLAEAVSWRAAPLQGRSVYGNLAAIGGELALDAKLYRGDVADVAGPWLSTSDQSWPEWRPRLAQLFPEPSPFEA